MVKPVRYPEREAPTASQPRCLAKEEVEGNPVRAELAVEEESAAAPVRAASFRSGSGGAPRSPRTSRR